MVTENKEIYEGKENDASDCNCNGDRSYNNDKNNGNCNENQRECGINGYDCTDDCDCNAESCNCGNHSHEEKGCFCGCDGSCESNADDCGCGTHTDCCSHRKTDEERKSVDKKQGGLGNIHSDGGADNGRKSMSENKGGCGCGTHTHDHSHAGGERKLDLASVLGIEKKTIGVFTDTHGNLPALEAIVPYLKAKKCDEIYHLGDTLCMGAFPHECMERLLKSNDIISVRGNHDNDYLDGITAKRGMSKVPPEHKGYMFAKAGDEFKEIIKDLPYVIVKDYFGLKVAFTHYARYFDEGLGRERFYVIDDNPTPESMDEMFKNVDADIIFMGHKHSPYVVKGKKLYIGIGSLGCHRYEYARGVILHVSPQFYYIEKVQVPYDRNATIEALDEREVPGADVMKSYYFNGQ